MNAGAIGFVPTMGALHAGHAALIRRARVDCAHVVVSIFVNPLQFGPGEDFERYPRTMEADVALLEKLGVDAIFSPQTLEMYPQPPQVRVDAGDPGRWLEGERRPEHFAGVAAVVLKLLHIVQPQRAYFGRKDAQQLAVITRIVADLNEPVEIVAVPTVRDFDGLALSSRNASLTSGQRRDAVRLPRALNALAQALAGKKLDIPSAISASAREVAPLRLDYLAVVDPSDFRPLDHVAQGASLLAVGAAYAGTVRLIDNVDILIP